MRPQERLHQARLHSRFVIVLVLIAWLFARSTEGATIIVVDFDTPATGSDLLSAPLLTPFGTITVTNATSIEPSFSTNSTAWLRHARLTNPGFASIIFDFDVASITFDYTGFGFGTFAASVRNISNDLLDSFFDPSTGGGDPDWVGPITLTGVGIRQFRFVDQQVNQSGVDNVLITPAAIPEPGTLTLLGLGLAGLRLGRRQTAS